MDKSDSHRRKKFKVPKPDSNVSTSHKWTIFVIRHAPQLANLCCDVIGDIAGIISGATTTLIVSELVAKFNLSGILPSLILTGIVSSLTIGGKAMSKGISMNNGNSIVFTVGKIMSVFKCCK